MDKLTSNLAIVGDDRGGTTASSSGLTILQLMESIVSRIMFVVGTSDESAEKGGRSSSDTERLHVFDWTMDY